MNCMHFVLRATATLLSGLWCGLGGVVWAGVTDMFVSSADTNQVLRDDGTTGAFVGVFASGGGLATPFGLDIGPDGNLYAAAQTNNKVFHYYGATGGLIGDFAFGGGLATPAYRVFTPEPGALTLLGIGGFMFTNHRRHGG